MHKGDLNIFVAGFALAAAVKAAAEGSAWIVLFQCVVIGFSIAAVVVSRRV